MNDHLADMPAGPAAQLLKAMRNEADLTVREMATELTMSPSTYGSKEDKFKKRYFPVDFVEKLETVLVPRGIPVNRVRALAGPAWAGRNEDDDNITDGDGTAAFEEWDIRGSMGGAIVDGEGVSETVNVWRLPRDLVRSVTYATPQRIKIITLVGDSMPKSFRPFEKVMVDTSDTRPTPPGIFMVFDGLGLVAKRVEHIAHSDPPTVRISSENPDYPAYERTLDEAYIQGRVLGRWQWV